MTEQFTDDMDRRLIVKAIDDGRYAVENLSVDTEANR